MGVAQWQSADLWSQMLRVRLPSPTPLRRRPKKMNPCRQIIALFNQLNSPQKKALLTVALIRLLAPLLLFWSLPAGIFAGLLCDGFDYELLHRKLKISHSAYQINDKFFDLYWYCLIIIYLLSENLAPQLNLLFLFLFAYRLIGQIVFFTTLERKNFLFFPNLFEPLFWVWAIFPQKSLSFFIAITLSFILPLKLFNEYYTHVLQKNPRQEIARFLHKK